MRTYAFASFKGEQQWTYSILFRGDALLVLLCTDASRRMPLESINPSAVTAVTHEFTIIVELAFDLEHLELRGNLD